MHTHPIAAAAATAHFNDLRRQAQDAQRLRELRGERQRRRINVRIAVTRVLRPRKALGEASPAGC